MELFNTLAWAAVGLGIFNAGMQIGAARERSSLRVMYAALADTMKSMRDTVAEHHANQADLQRMLDQLTALNGQESDQ